MPLNRETETEPIFMLFFSGIDFSMIIQILSTLLFMIEGRNYKAGLGKLANIPDVLYAFIYHSSAAQKLIIHSR